jgi:hypothetical protein
MRFSEADITAPGSDRLHDAIVAWGSPTKVAGQLPEHLYAGADHIAINALPDGDPLISTLTALAAALKLTT